MAVTYEQFVRLLLRETTCAFLDELVLILAVVSSALKRSQYGARLPRSNELTVKNILERGIAVDAEPLSNSLDAIRPKSSLSVDVCDLVGRD